MESILTSVKKLLGIAEDYTQFDVDIIMHINATFMTLNQLGIGPEEGFSISSNVETWDSYLGEITNLEAVKSYMALKVRLLFDPPASSAHVDAIKRQIDEYEFRLLTQIEHLKEE